MQHSARQGKEIDLEMRDLQVSATPWNIPIIIRNEQVSGSSSVGLTFPINPGFAAGSSRPEQGSLLVLVPRSGFKCGQSGAVLLTSAMVTTVTTLWEGVLDLWSGHARLLPCPWCEPKGVLRYLGDGGDRGGGGAAHGGSEAREPI